MSDQTPFIIQDAHVYLYTVDAADAPLLAVYLGGCAETIQLEQTLVPRRLEYHGLRYAREKHDDEEHLIEIKNVWLHDRSTATPRMPAGHARNVRYALVIIWEDDEAGVWTKRTYYGATARGQRIEDSTYESLKFRAESLIESAGTLETGDPSALPGVSGVVRYIGDVEVVDLYDYDADTAAFTVIDPALLAGRAEVHVEAGFAEIFFNGVPALYATTASTAITRLIATGSTILDQVPRLEFRLMQARVAALGADGTLVVINLAEGGNPELGADFEFRTSENEWLFSFNAPKSFFPQIREVPEV